MSRVPCAMVPERDIISYGISRPLLYKFLKNIITTSSLNNIS